MGYRSDIAIAIHKDLQGDFLTFLNTEQLMADIFGERSDFTLDKDYKGEGHWLFTADSIKWYTTWEEYRDIRMFEKFMETMQEDETKEEKFRFLRIGEEVEDIEFRGGWYEADIYVKREIQIGW
tara:strand:- start:620 stop:991 length:372 start_codon:yes stop_codon:yes gene_type:complete